ncbi:hypothetical protein LWL40_27815 (plasmid) [Bacillus thuringiensis]|uniref:hypothetical protein n=1 Tax=Bacillus thuringiensis TaxID=1428 RepID=UPI003D7575F3
MTKIVRGNLLQIEVGGAIRALSSYAQELRVRLVESEVLYTKTNNDQIYQQYLNYGRELDKVSEMIAYLEEKRG